MDEVRLIDEMPEWLEGQLRGGDSAGGTGGKLYLMEGQNSDSGNFFLPATFDGIKAFEDVRDITTLFPVLAEARVHKSEPEIELMRYVDWVSSMAVSLHPRHRSALCIENLLFHFFQPSVPG